MTWLGLGLGVDSIACASRRRAIDSGGEQAVEEESKRGSYAEKRGPQRREIKGPEAWLLGYGIQSLSTISLQSIVTLAGVYRTMVLALRRMTARADKVHATPGV